MNTITRATIQAHLDELVAMLAAFNENNFRTITLPAATIELRPGEQYAGLAQKDADARNRAMRLADAYAVMDIETEGIKAVGPSEWLITHDSLCDDLTADSIEHLRYRRLALIDDADGGLLVHLETDA